MLWLCSDYHSHFFGECLLPHIIQLETGLSLRVRPEYRANCSGGLEIIRICCGRYRVHKIDDSANGEFVISLLHRTWADCICVT